MIQTNDLYTNYIYISVYRYIQIMYLYIERESFYIFYYSREF